MDPELNREVLDVRKVIEKSTSKVSLRDLEKKGFRQVKVLRAGDINQLIFKAVQNVLAKQPRGAGMSEEERERIIKEARAEVDQQMSAMREIQQESQRIEAEKETLQQAHKNLEAKLAEVNRQLAAERQAVLREKQAFLTEKQQLFEKGLEGQQLAERKYESQLQDLQERLRRAEAKAEAAEHMVSREEHGALQQRLARAEAKAEASEHMVSREEHAALQQRLARAEAKVEAAEAKLRSADGAVPREEHEQALARAKAQHEAELQEIETRSTRYRRHADELEESESRLRSKAAGLQEDVARLEGEVARLKRELEEVEQNPRASGMGSVDAQELQRMRMEMERNAEKNREMFQTLASTLVQAKNAPQDPADLQKHFKSLQQGLQDSLRKMAGSAAGKGGVGTDYLELTAEHAAAIFAEQDQVKVETNIKDIAVKEQAAAGVKDKLSKLKNLRGGNKG
ncbi:MAG: hypothetical protein KF878_12945 [Planctomycetes bacterium]|nr:hypothetical protein [Planctomycetota bacterium]